jgi:hypothetical protein
MSWAQVWPQILGVEQLGVPLAFGVHLPDGKGIEILIGAPAEVDAQLGLGV